MPSPDWVADPCASFQGGWCRVYYDHVEIKSTCHPRLTHPSYSLFIQSFPSNPLTLHHHGKSRSHGVYLHALRLDHRVIDLHHHGGIGLHKCQLKYPK
jgi:hypothetical protein